MFNNKYRRSNILVLILSMALLTGLVFDTRGIDSAFASHPLTIPSVNDWDAGTPAFSQGVEGDWDYYLWGGFANSLVKKGNTYFLYYQGATGYDVPCDDVTFRAIGVATSPDGIHWTKSPNNPVITWAATGSSMEGAASGTAWVGTDGKIYIYYGANSGYDSSCYIHASARLAVSDDGENFTDLGEVLPYDDPAVWGHGDELFPVGAYAYGNRWNMFYIPNGVPETGKLGLASGDGNSQLTQSSAVNVPAIDGWGPVSVIVNGADSLLFTNPKGVNNPLNIYRFDAAIPSQVNLYDSYQLPGCYQASVIQENSGQRWLMACRGAGSNDYVIREAVFTEPFEAGTHDDVDSRFFYSGNWMAQTGVTGAANGTLHVSNTVGNRIKFKYSGDELRVFFQAGPSHGTIRLTLDNTSYVMSQSSASAQMYEWVLAAGTNETHNVTITHEGGSQVNLDAILVPGIPTTLTITSDMPDPSEIDQSVPVTVTLVDLNNAPVPNATIEIGGGDVNCQIITGADGTGSCTVVFSSAGSKIITAAYPGDAKYLGSSDDENHEVTLIDTVTTIMSDLPDPSVTNGQFVVTVQVSGSKTPTGTVAVDGGSGVGCTILLSGGMGNCSLSYSTIGSKTLIATYQGSSLFLPSTDTEIHQVIQPPPTPTSTPPHALSVHVGDLDKTIKATAQYWQANVIVTVHDNNHLPVANATVYGKWSVGYKQSVSCVTNSMGSCIIRSGTIRAGYPLIFTVKNVTYNTVPYLPADNHDPDRDGNGTSITVRK